MKPVDPLRGRHVRLRKYGRLAETYDTRWSFYVERTTDETATRLSLCPADRVLDVGCGTGALLARLARSHPPACLAGVDPVPEMLAVARRRLPSAVALREGWAEALPFERGEFDVVVSCNMFHYIARPDAALREIRRVLRPGGRLVVTDWCDDYWACRVCDLWLRLFSRAHVKTYTQQACAELLADNGYAAIQIDRYKISRLWGLMTAIVQRPRF